MCLVVEQSQRNREGVCPSHSQPDLRHTRPAGRKSTWMGLHRTGKYILSVAEICVNQDPFFILTPRDWPSYCLAPTPCPFLVTHSCVGPTFFSIPSAFCKNDSLIAMEGHWNPRQESSDHVTCEQEHSTPKRSPARIMLWPSSFYSRNENWFQESLPQYVFIYTCKW